VAGFFARRGFGPPVPVGTYKVVLTVDGQEFTQPLKVESDPGYPNAAELTLEAIEAIENSDRDIDMDADADADRDAEAPRRPIDDE
jgi:hypothetical protein